MITVLFMNGETFGIVPASSAPGYVSRLFDSSRVHTLDLQVEDWDSFLETAPEETYIPCTVQIDGETFIQVGLRAKGNNSKRLTSEYGLPRYSLKLEFDHYTDGYTYYGLDKFSLDSSFQDNSYMKTMLAFRLMEEMGVPTPLCSYVDVTVNGEPWGLFLAIEEPEEAFAKRQFGADYGKLYKPDYRSLNAENADVDLRYTTDEISDYDNIFRNAKFDLTEADQIRVIQALKTLSQAELLYENGQYSELKQAIHVDEVLRYFAVQVFVMNFDSYIGPTGHNYFLHEKDGQISILPWDYNLAFGTYCLGMTNPIRDPNVLINYPVNTPWEGDVMLQRPLFHQLMKVDSCFLDYRGYLDQLVRDYVESGWCEAFLRKTMKQIAPYVEKDVTAFCTYEDFETAVEVLIQVCRLRGASIRGQLDGIYPATLRERTEHPEAGVDASHVDLRDLGDFEDLREAQRRWESRSGNRMSYSEDG